jgi:acetyl esterase/lipase
MGAHQAFRRGGVTRGRRALRRLLAALLAVIAGMLGALTLYYTSVQPGAALMAAVFENGQLVKPPAGFALIARTVTEQRVSVPTAGAPTAYLDIYTPDSTGDKPRPVIFWAHGGGWVEGSAAKIADYSTMLAHEGYTVASLDYSLAPGAHYPVPVRQANAALLYMRDNASRYGGDPDRIVLGGDSAGAQIISQLTAVQTDAVLARSMGLTAAVPRSALRGVVLFCGIYDMRTVGGTGFPALRTFLWAYTGTRDWTSYPEINQLSTVLNVTSRYPPTFLSDGDADPFRSQDVEFASVLKSHSVPLTTLLWTGTDDGLGHEYQFNFNTPEARTAFQRTLGFLTAVTKG